MTVAILDEILTAARRRKERTPRYGISNALDCPRKLVMGFDAPESEGEAPARWNMAMVKGWAIDDWLAEHARGIGLQTQVPVRLRNEHGLDIKGTADVVGPDFVADFKLAGPWKWKQVQQAADVEHRNQVHTYAVALGKPKASVWYVLDETRGEVIPRNAWTEPTDPTCAEKVIDAWYTVDTHRAFGTLPARPSGFTPDCFECKVCRFNKKCWEAP